MKSIFSTKTQILTALLMLLFVNVSLSQEVRDTDKNKKVIVTDKRVDINKSQTNNDIKDKQPEFIDTGNPMEDEKVYQTRKAEWIRKNENPDYVYTEKNLNVKDQLTPEQVKAKRNSQLSK